jgi:osmoprotectant transport system permease protein
MWLALACLTLLGLFALPWLNVAPNRLLPGEPVFVLRGLGSWAPMMAVAIVAAALVAPSATSALSAGIPLGRMLPPLFLIAAVAVLLAATGIAASELLTGRPSAARASPGAGFWLALACLFIMTIEAARAAGRWAPPLLAVALGAVLLGIAAAGFLDALSPMMEYRARASAVHAALLRHLQLSAAALALALSVAVPFAFAAFQHRRAEAAAGSVLSALQVTPALALFGLLIPLIAALLAWMPGLRSVGLSAIGATPALIGVAVYVALPLFRGLLAGLNAADPAAVEAARSMGMSEGQITREVRLPLGAPILVGAIRVATVQSIGLMVLGGLIGAGGLGAVVFEGMSQLAPDLILLGALPVIGIAIAADVALSGLEGASRRRRR